MDEPEYQWGMRMTWTEEFGGHTEVKARSSEGDARRVVEQMERSDRIAKVELVRRPVVAWEVVKH